MKLRRVAASARHRGPVSRGITTLVIGRRRMLLMRKGTRHPGNILTGAINHPGIAVMVQTIRHGKIAGMAARVGHLPHRHRLEMRVRRSLDLGRIDTAIDEVMLRVEGEVVVHLRTVEKVVGVMAMLEMIKRMGVAEMVEIAKRKAM